MRVRRSGGICTGAVAAASLLALVATACGYRPLDGRDAFGPGVRTIELVSFENESREPGFEQQVADALNEEFSRRGWLEPQLGGEAAGSDLVMNGIVHSAFVRANSYSSGGLALEERLEVRFDVSVRRSTSGELVYQHPDFRITEVFLSSADPNVYASNKEQALRRVSSAIAERVHDELFQGF